jgi:hypothetical protein
VLLFEARARLAAYDSEGQTQVYRYDSAKGLLECLSCNPTGAPPVGEASLQSVAIERGTPEPFGSYSVVANIRPDGRRAFFQSEDPLVPADFDGLQDVYEWEDQGVGSCTKPTGCVYLISSGNSESADYLFGVSGTGDDVFFRSADLLLPADTDETPSIYDARVDGGFAEATGVVCQGEGCRGAMAEPPAFSTPASRSSSPLKKCPKGKRKTKRHGRRVCVKKHRPRHHKHRSRHKGARK